MLLSQPLWFLNISITPIMDSQNDREVAGRQQLLVIVLVISIEETVRSGKRKSSANLRAIVCEVIYRIS